MTTTRRLWGLGFSLCAALLFACAGTSVGDACDGDDDCDSGQTCYTDLPGGYCTKGCTVEGKTDECPRGSVCAVSGQHQLCAVECQTQADCRADYECNGVTGTNLKVCRPKQP